MKMFLPMPDNISGNAKQNLKLQELGKQFFHGDQFANQYASRPPVDPAMPVPPQPDPNMFSPFNKEKKATKKKAEKVKLHEAKPPLAPPRHEKFHIGVNMNGDPKKYRMPLEGVQDLQDMGAVKEDKKGQYVVNENATSVSDTLRFPKGTKHYSGKPYKTGQLIDESDYEDIIKKVNKS